MKQIMIVGAVLVCTISYIQATQLKNATNLPAKITVTYSMQCGQTENQEGTESEYTFKLPAAAVVDISGTLASALRNTKGVKACETTIASIKAAITFSDEVTSLVRTWDGPFKEFITITSAPSGYSIPAKALSLQ